MLPNFKGAQWTIHILSQWKKNTYFLNLGYVYELWFNSPAQESCFMKSISMQKCSTHCYLTIRRTILHNLRYFFISFFVSSKYDGPLGSSTQFHSSYTHTHTPTRSVISIRHTHPVIFLVLLILLPVVHFSWQIWLFLQYSNNAFYT
jgi:hypothetical protein